MKKSKPSFYQTTKSIQIKQLIKNEEIRQSRILDPKNQFITANNSKYREKYHLDKLIKMKNEI